MPGNYRQLDRESGLKVLLMAITQNPQFIVSQLTLAATLLSRRVRRLPSAARFALLLLLMLFLSYWMFGNQLTSSTFLEVDKCPACFGFTVCDAARSGNVWFTGWSRISLLYYFTADYNYDGIAEGKSVVLTKLASHQEIAAWEKRICLSAKQAPRCEISKAAVKALMASGSKWLTSYVAGMSKLTACPTERLLDKIMDRYREKLDAINLSARERIQLILTIMLNQEPIIFQTFPQSEGWPFPKYVGACGRFVAIESGYRPLHEFYEVAWSDRANLALKLLLIAKVFTNNKSQYGLYWTDISYATFAVNEVSLDVVVVDGRNIVVVDLYQIKEDKKRNWDHPLYSQFDNCVNKNTCPLSEDETSALCDRHVADRNYYAVCRFILSPYAQHQGRSFSLLHDTPTAIDSVFAISELVESCTTPAQPRQRLDAAAQLIKILSELVGSKSLTVTSKH